MSIPFRRCTTLPAIISVLIVTVCGFLGLAFTLAPTSSAIPNERISGEGWQTPLAPPHGLNLLYNDATPARIYYRPKQTEITPENPWKPVLSLPEPAGDGSNELRLYDANSRSLPAHLGTPQNIASHATGNIAVFGMWRANIDELGQTWVWMESGVEDDNEENISTGAYPLKNLPPVTTVALGANHLVALTVEGDVWAMELSAERFPTGLAPPVKLENSPPARAIGAWQEYGLASAPDGTLWIWRGYDAGSFFTQVEAQAMVAFLAGESHQTVTAPVASPSNISSIKGSSPSLQTVALGTTPTLASPPVEGMCLWLKADAGIVADAEGKISQWQDMSGKNNHANQTTAARQPQATTTPDGMPSISFAASASQYLTLPNLMAGAASGEVFIVTRVATAAPASIRSLWRFGSESTGGYYPHINGTLYDSFGSNVVKNTATPGTDLTQWHLYNVATTSGEWTSRLNGIPQHRATTNTVAWLAAPFLGRGNSYYYDGDIAEVIIYNRILSEGERREVEAYLAGHCQLASMAPSVPANPDATALDDRHAIVSWQATIAPWTTFELQRSIGNGVFQTIAQTSSASYLDSGLSPGISARYRVRTVTSRGYSAWSDEVSIETPHTSIGSFPKENIRLWLKADSEPLGPIASWRDLGPAGHTAISPAPANSPQVVQDGQKRKAVSFAAASSQHFSLSSVMSGAVAGEVFIATRVANSTPSTIRSLWRFGSEATGGYYPYTNGSLYDAFGSNINKSTGTPNANLAQWHIYNASSGAGSWSSRINGALHYDTTTNTVGWQAIPFLGRGGSYYYDGDIAEMLIFDRALTDAERNLIGRYLCARVQPDAITIPITPQPLQARCSGAGEAWVTWPTAETSIPSAGYILERRGPAGQWQEIANLAQTCTSYLDRDLAAGSYDYRIKARSWAGDASYGNHATVAIVSAASSNVPSEGLRLWLRADLGIAADSTGAIEEWLDLSGQANHAKQAIAASRPALVTASTTDAHPVVRFAKATQQKLDLPANLMTGASAGDTFVILRANAAKPTAHSGLWRLGSAIGYYPSTAGALTDGFGSNTARDLGVAQTDITRRHLLEVTAAPGQWIARINGFEQISATTNIVAWYATPLLGHNGSGTSAFDGDIEEVLVYDRVLSDAEREQIRLHLNARHQLADAFPASPGELQARPGIQGGVELSWPAPALLPVTQTEYILERSIDGGPFAEIARTLWHNFTDSAAEPGHTYTYRIKTRNWFGDSAYITAESLHLGSADALPAIPGREHLRIWLRADQGIFIENAPDNRIQRWQDQSGNGNHAAQSIIANRPTLATDTITGIPVVRFASGLKQSLSLSNAMQGVASAEIIIRAKTGAATYTTDNGLWKWSTYGAAYPSRTATLVDGAASNANQLQGSPILPLNEWRTYSISAAPGEWVSRLDKLEQYRAATNTVSFLAAPLLGTNGSTWFDGDVAEILVFDRMLSDEEREQLYRYLDARVDTGAAPEPPATPSGLAATAESSTTVAVRWQPAPQTTSGLVYILERSIGGGEFSEVLRFAHGYENRSDYTDRNVVADTAYTYRLKARNASGQESAYSTPATATTPLPDSSGSNWPTDLAPDNLRLWLRSDIGLVKSHDNRLVAWEDQSGRTNHATQTTVANQVVAGEGPVSFDAAKAAFLALPGPLFDKMTAGDVFIVLKTTPSTPAASRGLWTFGSGASYYLQNNHTLSESLGTSAARMLGEPLVDTTAWHVYNVTVSASEWTARLNGLEQYRDTAANTIRFGTLPKLGQGSGFFHGDIAEVLVFDRVLTASERERITKHLNIRHPSLPKVATVPKTPTELTAMSDNPRSALVTWVLPEAASIGCTYTLERSTGATGTFAPVFSFAQGTAVRRDYTDTDVIPGQTYVYRFQARDQVGLLSPYGTEASVTIATAAAPGTLAQTAGLRLWLRADRGIVQSSTGQVLAWEDQSGRKNHASQLTAANAPVAPVVAENNRTALTFDPARNTQLTLPATVMDGAVGGEALVVLKALTAASGSARGLWRMGYSNSSNYPSATGTLTDDFGNSVKRDMGLPLAATDEWHLYQVTSVAGQWTARINGIEQYATNANTVRWAAAPLLGSNGSAGFDGEIAEVILYDHALSAEERTGTLTYLDQRYSGLNLFSAPPAPAHLRASENSPWGVVLNWTTATVETACEHILERRDGPDGEFVEIARPSRYDRAYTDTTGVIGHTYAYRLRTFNPGNQTFSAYSNEAVITLTESSGSQSLSQGLRLWLRAGEGLVPAGSNRIAQWADQSGRGNHATQANVANMPALREGAGNEGCAIHFVSSKNQNLSLPNFMTGADKGEAFVVLKTNTAANSQAGLWRMGYNALSYYPRTDGTLMDDAGNATSRQMGLPRINTSEWHVYNIASDAGEWVARLNDTEQHRATPNTVRWATAPLIGSNGGVGFNGEIAEVLVYDRVLTPAERTTLQHYLARKHMAAAREVPPAPENLRAVPLGTGQVSLDWQTDLRSWQRQELQRKTGNGEFVTLAHPEGRSHLDTGLLPGETYAYRIRVGSPAGDGPWSIPVEVLLPDDAEDTAAIPLSHLRLWLKADALAEGATGVWNDQSGSGNHATASASARRPTVRTDETGRHVVHFSTTDNQYLTLPNFMNGAGEGEIFAVVKATDAVPATFRSLWRMGTGTQCYYPFTDGILRDDTGTSSANVLGLPRADITQWNVYNVSSKTGEWTARLNGATQHVSATNTVRWATAPLIGSNSSHGFDGDIAEILVFDRVLSSAERASVHSLLATRNRLLEIPNLPVPQNLQAAKLGDGQLSLTWECSTPAWTWQELQRKTGEGDYVSLGKLDQCLYLDNGLLPGSTYTYRVRTASRMGCGAWSEPLTVALAREGRDVLPLENLRLWLKADTLPEGTVSYWRDQSGRGNDAFAAALNSSPVASSGGEPGMSSVVFTPTSQLKLPNFMNSATEGEIIIVLKSTAPAKGLGRLWKMGQGSGGYYSDTVGQLTDDTGSSRIRNLGVPSLEIRQWHMFSVSSKADEWVARLNGAEQYRDDATASTVTWPAAPLLGNSFTGEVAEVMAFDRVLTPGERETVHLYVGGKFFQSDNQESLPPPTQLAAVAEVWNQVKLQWTPSSAWGAYHEVERRESGGAFAKVADLPPGAASWQDDTVSGEQNYVYRVRARVGSRCSAYSNEAAVTTPGTPPGAPTQLKAEAVGHNAVALSWTGVEEADATYELERATGTGTFARITTLGQSVTAYTDRPVQKGTTYSYRVRAIRASAPSDYSNTARVTTCPVDLPPPTGLTIDVQSNFWGYVQISWDAYPRAIRAYELERQAENGTFVRVFYGSGGETSWTDKDVEEGKTYTYRLRVEDIANYRFYYSDYCPEIEITAREPGAGFSVWAVAESDSGVFLGWTADLIPETVYTVERKVGSGEFATVATTDELWLRDTGLVPDAYTYRVRRDQPEQPPRWSNEVTVDLANPTETVFPTGGLRLWLKPESLVSQEITHWQDASGSNHHVPLPPANRPAVVVDGQLGLAALEFDADRENGLALPDLLSHAEEGEVFVLVRNHEWDSGVVSRLWDWNGLGNSRYGIDGIEEDFGGQDVWANYYWWMTGDDPQGWNVYNVRSTSRTGAAPDLYVNGARHEMSYYRTPARFSATPQLAPEFSGEIAELLVFDRVLSDTERRQVTDHLIERMVSRSGGGSNNGEDDDVPQAVINYRDRGGAVEMKLDWPSDNPFVNLLTWEAQGGVKVLWRMQVAGSFPYHTRGATLESLEKNGIRSQGAWVIVAVIRPGQTGYEDNMIQLGSESGYAYRLLSPGEDPNQPGGKIAVHISAGDNSPREEGLLTQEIDLQVAAADKDQVTLEWRFNVSDPVLQKIRSVNLYKNEVPIKQWKPTFYYGPREKTGQMTFPTEEGEYGLNVYKATVTYDSLQESEGAWALVNNAVTYVDQRNIILNVPSEKGTFSERGPAFYNLTVHNRDGQAREVTLCWRETVLVAQTNRKTVRERTASVTFASGQTEKIVGREVTLTGEEEELRAQQKLDWDVWVDFLQPQLSLEPANGRLSRTQADVIFCGSYDKGRIFGNDRNNYSGAVDKNSHFLPGKVMPYLAQVSRAWPVGDIYHSMERSGVEGALPLRLRSATPRDLAFPTGALKEGRIEVLEGADCVRLLEAEEWTPANGTKLRRWSEIAFGQIVSGRALELIPVKAGTVRLRLVEAAPASWYDVNGVLQTELAGPELKLIISHGLAVDANRNGVIDEQDKCLTTKLNPWRFWVNDDHDNGDTASNDEPVYDKRANHRLSEPGGVGKVDGRCDLIDFFPLWVDSKVLLASSQQEGELDVALRRGITTSTRQAPLMNIVYTQLSPANATSYQRQETGRHYGPTLDQAVHMANTVGMGGIVQEKRGNRITNVLKPELSLSVAFVDYAKLGSGGIVLLEAAAASTAPLEMHLRYRGAPIATYELPMSTSSVEQMYRWVNLRWEGGEEGIKRPSNHLTEPPNWPDSLTNGKNFVFLHGYNVSEQESRAWGSESFKRMFWSGSRAKPYFVSWYGHDSQVEMDIGVFSASFTPNFHVNVEHALQTAPHLAAFINYNLQGDVTTCAHSLGNMVVLRALNLGPNSARISRHFAFDAAVPAEALDGTLKDRAGMIHSAWDARTEKDSDSNAVHSSLWACNWHKLFLEKDAAGELLDYRGNLTWRDKLANLPTTAEVYNFYSSGEQVLNYCADKPTPAWNGNLWTIMGGAAGAAQGEYAWWGQELFKGRYAIDGLVGSDYGGWNVAEGRQIVVKVVPDAFGKFHKVMRQPTRQEINQMTSGWTDENKRKEPLFLWGTEKYIRSASGGSESPLSELYSSRGSEFAARFHNKLLADMIPATTGAMGREAVVKLNKNPDDSPKPDEHNFDLSNGSSLEAVSDFQSGWPQERIDNDSKRYRWLHGDAKDVAYYFNYPLWDKWVELGNLNEEKN